jgi:hypothetical protein
MASITPHKDGWRVQVYVGGTRDSKVVRTQREAKAWGAARELELRALKDRPQAELHTVAEALKRYGEEVPPRKRGERAEQLRLAAFMRDFEDLAALPLSEFKTPQLAQWRDARLKIVSTAAVNRDINLLRNVFAIARQEWHWMEHNPFEGFRLPPEAAPRSRRTNPWKEVRPPALPSSLWVPSPQSASRLPARPRDTSALKRDRIPNRQHACRASPPESCRRFRAGDQAIRGFLNASLHNLFVGYLRVRIKDLLPEAVEALIKACGRVPARTGQSRVTELREVGVRILGAVEFQVPSSELREGISGELLKRVLAVNVFQGRAVSWGLGREHRPVLDLLP